MIFCTWLLLSLIFLNIVCLLGFWSVFEKNSVSNCILATLVPSVCVSVNRTVLSSLYFDPCNIARNSPSNGYLYRTNNRDGGTKIHENDVDILDLIDTLELYGLINDRIDKYNNHNLV